MRKTFANAAPFAGIDNYDYPPDPCLTKAVADKNGRIVRRCGSAVDVHAMAEEMNMRAAETIMVEGTKADPNLNSSMWDPYDGERYNK